MRTPPQIEPSELFRKNEVLWLLNITEKQFMQGVADGDLRQIEKSGVFWYKGTDILYYYFKHLKNQ